jgi:hypothetical protein
MYFIIHGLRVKDIFQKFLFIKLNVMIAKILLKYKKMELVMCRFIKWMS